MNQIVYRAVQQGSHVATSTDGFRNNLRPHGRPPPAGGTNEHRKHHHHHPQPEADHCRGAAVRWRCGSRYGLVRRHRRSRNPSGRTKTRCPGDPPVATGNIRVNPVIWDNNICHEYWYVYHGQGNVAQNIWDGPNPPGPPPAKGSSLRRPFRRGGAGASSCRRRALSNSHVEPTLTRSTNGASPQPDEACLWSVGCLGLRSVGVRECLRTAIGGVCVAENRRSWLLVGSVITKSPPRPGAHNAIIADLAMPVVPAHAAGGHGCAVYSSSVTDAEWAILEPLLPAPVRSRRLHHRAGLGRRRLWRVRQRAVRGERR